MSIEKSITYSKDNVVVVWQPELCSHSGLCIKGLPKVFNPNAKPWINLSEADIMSVSAQVAKCPSGALSIRKHNVAHETGQEAVCITISSNGPLLVSGKVLIKDANGNEVLKEKTTALCRCGASSNKPYCDGAHRKINFNG